MKIPLPAIRQMRGNVHFGNLLCGLALLTSGCKDSNIVTIPPDAITINVEPACGPDGLSIAYTHYPQTPDEQLQGPSQIWVGSPAGPGKFITAGRSPNWSPDGTHLTFVRQANVWIVDLATLQETRVTDLGSCFRPAWSPDGAYVAYKVESNTNIVPPDSSGIWVTQLANGHRTQLARSLGGDPAWSPLGDKIAIKAVLGQPGNEEIAVIDVASHSLQRLTLRASDDESPAWSPDGKYIAWTASSSDVGIYRMDSDGSNVRPLVTGGADPSYSADGSYLVFVRQDLQTGVVSLWSSKADGSNASPLTW